MTDPYKVLGVSPYDTDEKIKSAYREFAKKYHPDNYQDSPLKDIADNKMKEINEAYDTIMETRRKNRQQNDESGYANQYAYNYTSKYNNVRKLIIESNIDDAEQILNEVSLEERDAEWYFLKASILYKKGLLEQAYINFEKATNMDPGNIEYKTAFNRIKNQREGMFGGYNQNAPMYGGCTGCDICSSLICADCCCECMGGDLIPCC